MDINRIQRIKNIDGEWIEGQQEVNKVIMEPFRKIYERDDGQNINAHLAAIP